MHQSEPRGRGGGGVMHSGICYGPLQIRSRKSRGEGGPFQLVLSAQRPVLTGGLTRIGQKTVVLLL